MKYLLILLISFSFLVWDSFSAEYTVSSVQQVPSGSTEIIPWSRYEKWGDIYNIASSRSNAWSAWVWVSPDTTDSTSIFWNTISNTDLRKWNVDMDTIPKAIVSVIEWLLAVAGTLSVCALIYHAVQMQLNSGITGDASGVDKAKKWMIGALLWFVISLLSWFLVTRLADILSSVS